MAVFINSEKNFRMGNEDHEDQTVWLNFTLPPGASRPELNSGHIPANPSAPGDQSLRIGFQVNAEGKPENFTVLESTDGNWEKDVLYELKSWRFRPSIREGRAVEAQGIFQLTHGRERPPAPK